MATLTSVSIDLFRYGGPILIVLGTISAAFNLIIFSEKTLRKNPCAIYIIAFNISNIFFIYASLLPTTLAIGYDIDPTSYNFTLCRLRYYTTFLFSSCSGFYLVLASIDRVLVTSSNALIRRRSTCRLAYISIIGSAIFWVLFHIHALVLTTMIQIAPNYYYCYFQSGWYITFISCYAAIVGISTSCLLFIFALLTLNNIRGIRHTRAVNITVASGTVAIAGEYSMSSKDKQFIMMLLIDVVVFIFFGFPIAIYLMYLQITQYQVKSIEQIQIESFLQYLASFCTYIPYCVSCYTHLLASKTFRNAVKKIFRWNN